MKVPLYSAIYISKNIKLWYPAAFIKHVESSTIRKSHFRSFPPSSFRAGKFIYLELWLSLWSRRAEVHNGIFCSFRWFICINKCQRAGLFPCHITEAFLIASKIQFYALHSCSTSTLELKAFRFQGPSSLRWNLCDFQPPINCQLTLRISNVYLLSFTDDCTITISGRCDLHSKWQ